MRTRDPVCGVANQDESFAWLQATGAGGEEAQDDEAEEAKPVTVRCDTWSLRVVHHEC